MGCPTVRLLPAGRVEERPTTDVLALFAAGRADKEGGRGEAEEENGGSFWPSAIIFINIYLHLFCFREYNGEAENEIEGGSERGGGEGQEKGGRERGK